MNHFLKLELAAGGYITIRPSVIASIESHNGDDYDVIVTTYSRPYTIKRGQISPDTLPMRTMSSGIRVIK